ncbi:regulatory protein [Mumia flava]|uniref:Regulatory protein RecX n=1 Tax=Mumia flava TaxID=1348852 RepID=A0A2M9BE24_9ACTN|nr:regulatory protein RecX [Mumia flava]PJJ56201.1 regulatory protein [Mumia flava]
MAGRRHSASRHARDAESDPSRDLGPPADPEAVGRKILLDRLTDQPRSRAELAAFLTRRRVPDDVAQQLLDRFEHVGLIDDEQFARMWVESRQRSRGLAGRAIAVELRRKGVEDDVVRDAVEAIEPEDEEDAARTLVRKKLRSLTRVADEQTKVRRLVGMLGRKGYGPGLAYRVVREELALSAEIDDGLPDGDALAFDAEINADSE